MLRENWRQGHVLPREAVEALGRSGDGACLMVCSHSCDLQRMEGNLLAIVAGTNAERDGGKAGGKSIRYLQLQTSRGEFIEYDIESLEFVDASILDRFTPIEDSQHVGDCDVIVGRWIAQRFDRLALPDSVVGALIDSGVQQALLKALERHVSKIDDVRVLLKEDGEVPSINFIVVYSDDAKQVAEEVTNAIKARAERRAADLDGRLIIEGAHAVSANSLTYAQWRDTRPFRADYLSLRAVPALEPPPR